MTTCESSDGSGWLKRFHVPQSRRGYFRLFAFLLVKLICTACLVAVLLQRNHDINADRLSILQGRLVREVERCVSTYGQALSGVRTALVVCTEVNQKNFDRIMQSGDVERWLPATAGIALIEYVRADEFDAFLERCRADDRPAFDVWSMDDTRRQDDYCVVSYAQPDSLEQQLAGLDIASDEDRREVAMLAARMGQLAVSKPVQISNEGANQTGFWMLLPYYNTPVPAETEEQRVASIAGWIYMKVAAEEVFKSASIIIDEELSFAIVDGDNGVDERTLYSFGGESTRHSEREAIGGADVPLDAHTQIAVGGRQWSILIRKTPEFRSASTAGAWLAGCSGVFLSAIVTLIFIAQQRTTNYAKQLAEQMTEEHRLQATTDRLTGLPNRNAITDRIQEAIHRAQRVANYRFAILFIDFDRFKIINDSMGHDSGDRLLQSISARLRSVLRTNDISSRFSPSDRRYENFAARLGGDEFIILLDGIESYDDASLVAERLVDTLRAPHDLGPVKVISTASVGVVLGHDHYADAGELIRDADIAMYEAKTAGKNRAVVFTPAMRERVSEHMNIESDLRRALKAGQIRMVYQPIVSLVSHQAARFEALMRWEHPERGAISPNEFIAVAEESDLIIDMDSYAIEQAAWQLAQWRSQGVAIDRFHVSVNLSRRSIISKGLLERVCQCLTKHDIEPCRLHLEVTERGFMLDPAGATLVLEKLRQMGVSIDLDDFGTGLSSLSCLDRLPIDTLKLDRGFVSGFVSDSKRVALVSALVHLSDHLGIDVVAEGVEDVEELMKLTQLGCGLAQGYYFSRPLEAVNVPEFLQRDQSGPRIAA